MTFPNNFTPLADYRNCTKQQAENLVWNVANYPGDITMRDISLLTGVLYMGRVFGYPLVFRMKGLASHRIKMGCRWFTLAQAKKHWSKQTRYGGPISSRARGMLKMLPAIELAVGHKWALWL